MNLDRILTSSPVNTTAARVVGRRRGIEDPGSLSREELIEIVNRLERKLRLLKVVLGITTKAQHKNLVWKFNKGFKSNRFKSDPRAVIEYKRCGEEKQRLSRRLQELRAERRAIAEAEHARKTQE